jgi:hypothetical protein
LLDKLNGKPVSSALRQDILNYYADLGKPFATKKNPEEWQNVLREVDALKTVAARGAIDCAKVLEHQRQGHTRFTIQHSSVCSE